MTEEYLTQPGPEDERDDLEYDDTADYDEDVEADDGYEEEYEEDALLAAGRDGRSGRGTGAPAEQDEAVQERGSRPQTRVPALQQESDLSAYIREEVESFDPDRIARAIETVVSTKVSTALNNFMELQAALEPDPDEALAKRLVTQALTMNPEAAKDRHLMTRARMVAAITNAEDPLQALAALQQKVGRKPKAAAAPTGPGLPPEARTPSAAAGKPGRPRSAEKALAEKLGLPEEYVKRLNLRG